MIIFHFVSVDLLALCSLYSVSFRNGNGNLATGI